MFNAAHLKASLVRKLGYKKIVSEEITRENFFELYFSLKRPFVVQLGANDGKTHDSLHHHILKNKFPGLLVEPQVDVFERLKHNYKDNPNLKFANVAAGEKDGEIPFYRIKPSLVMEGKEYKASSGSSFWREQIVVNVKNRLPPMRNNILKHVSDDPNDYIEEIKVKVMTLNSLFHEFGVEKVDFLFTDCQGADYALLKQLDFKRFSPDIINFEHSLLHPEELLASRRLLKDHGYKHFIHEGDTCAYRIS
jgi:FkbM family methyltransferase